MAKKTNPVNTSARTKAKSVPDLPTKTLSNLTKYKSDLDRLIQSGNVLDTAIQFECLPGSFEEHFQKMKLSAAKISEFKKEIPRFSEKPTFRAGFHLAGGLLSRSGWRPAECLCPISPMA